MAKLETTKINDLKKRLEAESVELEKDLGSIARKNPDNPTDWEAKPDEVGEPDFREDIAERWETQEERSETTNALEKRLANVKLALTKINSDKFGVCEVGGEDIELDRIEANPAARTCKTHLSSEDQLD